MAIKILLNSLYGALGNKYFRYFDMRMAEGITLSGQLSVMWAEKAVKLSGGSPFMKAGLAYVYSRAGKIESAKKIRDELLELANAGYLFHGPLATVYVALNEKDEAIRCLKLAYENKEVSMFLIRMWYEDYLGSDLLSDDPWFIELQKKMGLE